MTRSSDRLPVFRYHPDPLATGSVAAQTGRCEVCATEREYLYVGPFYSVDVDEPVICPWCIADGSAAVELNGEFVDLEGSAHEDVPFGVVDELATRTPGFDGWQQEHWLFHCSDAAAFLGRVGSTPATSGAPALDAIRRTDEELGLSDDAIDKHLAAIDDGDDDHSAYLFRCLTCATLLAYCDMS